ncbi:winged helix-turn-helix transcriptional regulator [Thermococcus sp. 2319x1]|uniref:winged helix-turn-helix transcriptional regulator n=1 Tax=Thermococcus sp. 2319x1 TaxID=1674923 RepID=UPI001E3124DF|nr:winged helix-turn-helix transcriptional regulator [Thermococcus sp. 2319x1]
MSTRERILDYVTKNPGITFRKLAQELNIGIGNLQYHLRHLEKEGKIISKRLGGKNTSSPRVLKKSTGVL